MRLKGIVNKIEESPLAIFYTTVNAQKMKFSITDFLSKCDQIRSFIRLWSHLLKKSVIANFIFYTMSVTSLRFLVWPGPRPTTQQKTGPLISWPNNKRRSLSKCQIPQKSTWKVNSNTFDTPFVLILKKKSWLLCKISKKAVSKFHL